MKAVVMSTSVPQAQRTLDMTDHMVLVGRHAGTRTGPEVVALLGGVKGAESSLDEMLPPSAPALAEPAQPRSSRLADEEGGTGRSPEAVCVAKIASPDCL